MILWTFIVLQTGETQEAGDTVDIQCALYWWDNRDWWFSEHSMCVKLVTWRLAILDQNSVVATFIVGTKLAMHGRDCWYLMAPPLQWTFTKCMDLRHSYDWHLMATPFHWTVCNSLCAWMDSWWLSTSEGNTISADINMAATNGSRWQHYCGGYSLARGNIISVDINWPEATPFHFQWIFIGKD